MEGDGQTDIQTYRQTYRHTDRQTDIREYWDSGESKNGYELNQAQIFLKENFP